MTSLLLALACHITAVDGTIHWLEARDAGQGIMIAEAGEYTVWAWCGPRAMQFTVGGQRVGVPAVDKKEEKGWSWRKAGRIALKPGKAAVGLGKAVAAVALSANDAVNIAQAAHDRRVLSAPEGVKDQRAKTAKETNTVFTMPEFTSKESWEKMSALLRRRILLSSGLWPLHEKTPLNAQVFDRVEREEYTVEKVHFEAFPGYLVTGNLYRPKGAGPFPAVVCPHGHWPKGRLENTEMGVIPARSITLAKLGAVTFTYDMVGYVDSVQFPHNWGGDAEKLWGIHPFALQLWASIRAVDFVSSLEGVDPERIGCTGASGGGTQTFALTAVDERVKVSAPVNMISCSMQGGCLCENAPLIRMDNSNMEIGAMMAPRPLLMVSATGDWTRETPRVEYPAIRSIYRLYGAEDHVASVQVDAGHNYNQASREAMYRFFAKWLLGRTDCDNYTEPPFEIEEEAKLRVFPDGKAPAGYPDHKTLLQNLRQARLEKAEKTLAENKALFDTALADVLGAALPAANDLQCERTFREAREGYVAEGWILHRAGAGDAVPALFYHGTDAAAQDAVLVAHGEGKAALAAPDGSGPGALVAGLLAQGKAVLCIDPFLTGEFHGPRGLTKRLRVGKFMDTFQPTDEGYRVQDILTGVRFLLARRDLSGTVDVMGLGEAGVSALFAGAIAKLPGSMTVVDWNQFDASSDAAWVERHYVPCIRAIGDVKTALAALDPGLVFGMNSVEQPGLPSVDELLKRYQ